MADANITGIVKKYLDILVTEKYQIVNAYLFGSYAKGNFNEDSDIDIALVFKKFKDRFDMRFELMKLGRKIDLRIEPHPFDESDVKDGNPLLNEVLKTGIKI